MNLRNLLVILATVFVTASCLSQSNRGEEPVADGRIAFAVDGRYVKKWGLVSVEIVLRNQETNEIHRKTLTTNLDVDKQVDYLEHLVPGVYLIEEYNGLWVHGREQQMDPAVEIEVKPGHTSLSPVFAELCSCAYPRAWLADITERAFWDDYDLNESENVH